MNVEEILSSKGPELLNTLQGVGFSAEQAQQFLPEVGEHIAGAVSGAGLGELLGGDAAGALLENIDLGSLASKLGLDGGLVEGGLRAIIPQILGALNGDAGVLGGLGSKLFR